MDRRVIVPPYCGLPRLSHQFPLAVVVVGVLVGVLVDVVEVLVVVVVFVVVVVDVGEEVVVFVAQDAKIRDAAIRQVSKIQIVPRFMQTSLYFGILLKNIETLFSEHSQHTIVTKYNKYNQ